MSRLGTHRDIESERSQIAEEKLSSAERLARVADMNAKKGRAVKNLFKTEAHCRLDVQVRANCTNSGVVNEHAIQKKQAEQRAILDSPGGHALPPPNYFRKARTRYDAPTK